MGKNKRKQIEVFDKVHNVLLNVDSLEEVEFIEWLNAACQMQIIKDFEYQPKSFELFKPQTWVNSKGKNRTLFREHIYTADFIIWIDKDKYPALADEFRIFARNASNEAEQSYAYYIDVKGGFMSNGSARSFPINQKWVYDKYGVYVHKIVPKDFFKKFGITEDLRLTRKTKKPSKKYEGYKLISEVF